MEGECASVYLEENVGTHGFAVSDDGLFIRAFSVPAIQFDAPVTRHSGSGSDKVDEGEREKEGKRETCIRPGVSGGTSQRWIYHQTVCRTSRCCATS